MPLIWNQAKIRYTQYANPNMTKIGKLTSAYQVWGKYIEMYLNTNTFGCITNTFQMKRINSLFFLCFLFSYTHYITSQHELDMTSFYEFFSDPTELRYISDKIIS